MKNNKKKVGLSALQLALIIAGSIIAAAENTVTWNYNADGIFANSTAYSLRGHRRFF